MRIIDEISSKIYTSENGIRAAQYLTTRGLDYARTSFPFVATNDSRISLSQNCVNPYSLTEALIMPLASIMNPRVLSGFSVRHIGTSTTRLRYMTIKDDPKQVLCYYTRPPFSIRNQPLFITESVIDAESITQTSGFASISFLSALFQPQILWWLSAITDNLVFALDNDTAGNRCFTKYREYSKKVLEYIPTLKIKRMSFPCKDINECLLKFGSDFLAQQAKLFV